MVVGLAVLVLLLPMEAVGQERSVQSLIERGQQAGANAERMRNVATRANKAGVSSEQTAEFLQPAVALAEQGLPTAPVLNKTLEGLAKRVPAGRMTPVLQNLQTHTERAGAVVSAWLDRGEGKQLMGGSDEPSAAARDQVITSATEAQQQGIPSSAVEQFLNTVPEAVDQQPVSLSQVSTAVRVMPDVPGSKTDPTVAQQVLTAALSAGYDGESLRQLPAALENAQRETQRPAAMIAQGVAQAIAQGTPAASVLRSLFQGSVPGGGLPSGVGNGPPSTPPGQGKPPGTGGKPPGTGPPDDPGQGGGPPDDNPGGGPPGDPGGGGGNGGGGNGGG